MGMTEIIPQSGLIHMETLISKVKQDTGALYGYGTCTKMWMFQINKFLVWFMVFNATFNNISVIS
jgi:hypothetical protein